ncbi:hypothetical protein PBRA_001055, partial [Plasmodiophora brassicae]
LTQAFQQSGPVATHVYPDLPLYEVYKSGKYGTAKARVVQINPAASRLLVATLGNRKIKRTYNLDGLVGVSMNDAADCQLRFRNEMLPEHGGALVSLQFADSCSRSEFIDQVRSCCKSPLDVSAPVQVRDDNMVRFAVTSVGRYGVRRSRTIYVDPSDKRMYIVRPPDLPVAVPLADIIDATRSSSDQRRASIRFQEKDAVKVKEFVFSCRSARETFLAQINENHNMGDEIAEPKQARTYSLWVGSWNTGKMPAADVESSVDWVPAGHDLYVVGLQECRNNQAWQAAIQAHLNGGDDEFVLLNSHSLWSILLLVFVRASLSGTVFITMTDSVGTGMNNLAGNKGAVVASLRIDDDVVCFTVCHLAARAERIFDRRSNIRHIMAEVKDDVYHTARHQVFFGDLNYRVIQEFSRVCSAIAAGALDALVSSDQLLDEIAQKAIFLGYHEGALAFAPTYRMERNSSEYSNKREQSPSWTDRILYKSRPGAENEFVLKEYRSHPTVLGSDHRPVSAVFNLKPRSSLHCGSLGGSRGPLPRIRFLYIDVCVPNISLVDEDLDPAETPVHLRISSEIEQNSLKSRAGTIVQTPDEAVRLHWNASDLPPLNSLITADDTYIASSHIEFHVYSLNSRLGSSIIALTTLFDSADAETGGMQFSADIGLHSQFIGTLNGAVMLELPL